MHIFQIKKITKRDADAVNKLFCLYRKLQSQRTIPMEQSQDERNRPFIFTKSVLQIFIQTCEKSVSS